MIDETEPSPQEGEDGGHTQARPTTRKYHQGNGNHCKHKQENLGWSHRRVVLTRHAIELLDGEREHSQNGIAIVKISCDRHDLILKI